MGCWMSLGQYSVRLTDSKQLHLLKRYSLILNDLRDILASIFVITSWLVFTAE